MFKAKYVLAYTAQFNSYIIYLTLGEYLHTVL